MAQMIAQEPQLSQDQLLLLRALEQQQQQAAPSNPLELAGQSPLLYGPDPSMQDLMAQSYAPPDPNAGLGAGTGGAAPVPNVDILSALNPLATQLGRNPGARAARPAPSPFEEDLADIVPAAGRLASDVGQSVQTFTDPARSYFSSPDSNVARRVRERDAAGSGEPEDARSLADLLERMGQDQAPTSMDPIAIGPGRGARPDAPGAGGSRPADYSQAREQLEMMRALAGETTDFSAMEDLVAQLAPEERTKQDRRDMHLSGVFAGLSSAGNRIDENTPVGSMLMQLGLGAIGGRAEGMRANEAADAEFAGLQREHINAQLNLNQFELSHADAQRQAQMSIEMQALGLSTQEAENVAETERANSNQQLQLALANYQVALEEWASGGAEMLGTIGDDGTMFYQFRDPSTGQMSIGGVNLPATAAAARQAAAGGSGEFASAISSAPSAAEAGAMLIQQWRDAGELQSIFEDEYDDIRQEAIQGAMPLAAFGSDGNEQAIVEIEARESAMFLNLLLTNPELLRSALASRYPAQGLN